MHRGKQRCHEIVDGKTHEALERQAEGVTTLGPDGFLTLVQVASTHKPYSAFEVAWVGS